MTGWAAVTGVTVRGYQMLYFGKDPVDIAKDLNVKNIRGVENWDVNSFARLLAKIAYSYSVAVLGLLPREQILVLPLILGEADNASVCIGSEDFRLEVEERKPLHALGYVWLPHPGDAKRELLSVLVKLFAPSGATGYQIIVAYREKQIISP